MSLAPHGGMPFSGRPLMTVVLKSSLDSVLSEVINEGPTKPSCSAPWQRSHANARHVFHPSRVLGSTLSPSCTVYGAAESWFAAWAVFAVRPAAASGSENTNSDPPKVVYLAKSLYPPTAPRPSCDSVKPAAMPMPA